MSKNRKPRVRYTDDSGVVISQEQYKKLHGEPEISERMHLLGAKLFKRNPRNIFAKIAKIKEKPNNKRHKKNLKNRAVKMLECEYCHAIVRWDAIGLHTRTVHNTKDLRFRPAGVMSTTVDKKQK